MSRIAVGDGLGTRAKTRDAVGVAIIGVGYWGPNLVRNLDTMRDSRLLWVCDRKPGRLRFVRERFPHVPLTEDYMTVLGDPAVDAVMIATPVSTHRDLALGALKAGKHVFVEKPLAGTSSEAAEVARAAKDLGRVAAVGHIFVHNAAVQKMKELIELGRIGRLCYAESGRVNLGPPASDVNVLWDLAVHDLSILLHLWGQPPVEVTAHGSRYLHPQLVDIAFVHLRFADGSMAQHHVSWLSPAKVRRFFVAGSKGSLAFDDTLPQGKLRVVDQGVDNRIGTRDDDAKELYYRPGDVLVPELSPVEPLRAECQHFLDCIREGTRPVSDGDFGLAVVRVLEAADESISHGSVPVRL